MSEQVGEGAEAPVVYRAPEGAVTLTSVRDGRIQLETYPSSYSLILKNLWSIDAEAILRAHGGGPIRSADFYIIHKSVLERLRQEIDAVSHDMDERIALAEARVDPTIAPTVPSMAETAQSLLDALRPV